MTSRTTRKIIHIDEEKCDGCGECVPACEEGAIQIVDGTAQLIDERYCDGLGDCIGECPQGAITIEERPAKEFDEAAVEEHLAAMEKQADEAAFTPSEEGGCPAARTMSQKTAQAPDAETSSSQVSALQNWPVQLTLVPPTAPWLQDANLLIASDCVPFALGNFHTKLLAGKKLIIACPKLDEPEPYVAKLTQIFAENNIASLTVARMEVPCCSGMVAIVQKAIEESNADIDLNEFVVSVDGEIADSAPNRGTP